MFKKLVILSFLFFVTIGCSTFGKVKITKDSFKNVHAVNMKLQIRSQESFPNAIFADSILEKYIATLDFTREIAADKVVPTVTRFTIYATEQNAPIERSGFLKVGEKTNPLAFGNTGSQSITKVTSTVSSSSTNTSSSNTLKTNVSTKSHTHKELTGTFLLKKEDEEDILKSNEFFIRLYSGAEAITIPVAGEDLEKFKEYLNARPEAGN